MTAITVRVGYLNNAWTESPAWITISDDVERVDIRRGRPVRGVAADIGRATIRLRNIIGEYDPEGERGRYGSSGYAFYSHPGKRIQVLYGTTVIFDGLIAAVSHEIDPAPEIVVYECLDRRTLLLQRTAAFAATTADEHAAFTSTLNSVLIGASWYATAGAASVTVALPAETTTVADRIDRIARAASGQLYISRAGIITYRSRYARYGAPVAILTNDAGIGEWRVNESRIGSTTIVRPTGWTPGVIEGVRIDECGPIVNDVRDIINTARIQRTGGAVQSVNISFIPGNDSLTKYNERLFEALDLSLADDTTALAMAQWTVLEYSQANLCPEFARIAVPAAIGAVAELDMFDVVEVRVTPRTAHPTRYGRTLRVRALVASLEWSLTATERSLTIGLEPTRGATPLLVGVSGVDGEISGEKVVI